MKLLADTDRHGEEQSLCEKKLKTGGGNSMHDEAKRRKEELCEQEETAQSEGEKRKKNKMIMRSLRGSSSQAQRACL